MFYLECSNISGKGWPFWQVFQRVKVYLNPIKFRAFLIFARFIFVLLIWAQLSNSYSSARIIFALWQNLYFRVGLSYDWKCSARQCVKYAEIRAFSYPYFPVYEQNRILIFPYWTESEILSKFGEMRIRFCPHTENTNQKHIAEENVFLHTKKIIVLLKERLLYFKLRSFFVILRSVLLNFLCWFPQFLCVLF